MRERELVTRRGAVVVCRGCSAAPSLCQLLVAQQPLLHQLSPAVVPAGPAAADHPVARDDDGDLQNTPKPGNGAKGEAEGSQEPRDVSLSDYGDDCGDLPQAGLHGFGVFQPE